MEKRKLNVVVHMPDDKESFEKNYIKTILEYTELLIKTAREKAVPLKTKTHDPD